MSSTTHHYTVLRNQLDNLGYTEPLPKDAVRLVDKLLNHMLNTTEKLNYYKALATSVTNERDALLITNQPCLSDNVKLRSEISDLNVELKKVKRDAENMKIGLEYEIKHLNKLNNELEKETRVQQSRVQELEFEMASKATDLLGLKGSGKGKNLKANKTSHKCCNNLAAGDADKSNSEVIELRERCKELEKDLNVLLDNEQQQIDLIHAYKKEIEKKDHEITQLLSSFHENSKLMSSRQSNDDHNHQILKNHYKNKYELRLSKVIEEQNKTLIYNQSLIEKNKQLEKELRDIDQIALNVEKHCNESLKDNKATIQSLKDELNKITFDKSCLEKEVKQLNCIKHDLQNRLKRYDTPRVSQYVQTENLFVDYSSRSKFYDDILTKKMYDYSQPQDNNFPKPAETMQPERLSMIDNYNQIPTNACCSKEHHFKDNFDIPESNQKYVQHTFSSWQKCYDKYVNKYAIKSSFCKNNCICNKCFHFINNLISCLDRKIDVLQSELLQNQSENSNLLHKLKITTEMKVSEQTKFYHKTSEDEQKICKLESERLELLKQKDSQTVIIDNLHHLCNQLENKLSLQEKDICNDRITYNQFKVIHEQTERTLSMIQQQLIEKEQQLITANHNKLDMERENRSLLENNKKLKLETENMKMMLKAISDEKIEHLNELDEKSEQLSKIREERVIIDQDLQILKNNIKELKVKLDDALQSRDALKKLLSEANLSKEEYFTDLEKLQTDCKNYAAENRRILNELSSVTCELQQTRHFLENSKKESADLQQQLQQYVIRVRQAEDIIAMKEKERSEILDQYRSLSQEALILETNNETLGKDLCESQKLLHQTNTTFKQTIEDQREMSSNSARVSTLNAEIDYYKQLSKKSRDELISLQKEHERLLQEKDKLLQENRCLINDKCEIKSNMDELTSELNKEVSAREGLEGLLDSCRREAIDYHLKVLDLTNELNELQNKMQILMSKLESERELSQRYKAQSHEYSVQLQEIRKLSTPEQIQRHKDFYTTI